MFPRTINNTGYGFCVSWSKPVHSSYCESRNGRTWAALYGSVSRSGGLGQSGHNPKRWRWKLMAWPGQGLGVTRWDFWLVPGWALNLIVWTPVKQVLSPESEKRWCCVFLLHPLRQAPAFLPIFLFLPFHLSLNICLPICVWSWGWLQHNMNVRQTLCLGYILTSAPPPRFKEIKTGCTELLKLALNSECNPVGLFLNFVTSSS